MLYRDLRTYGERESALPRGAQGGGDLHPLRPGRQTARWRWWTASCSVTVSITCCSGPSALRPDLITLAIGHLAERDEALAQFFKVPVNEDGFFIEAHAKLRPVDFATDGVFLCGLAHYPKPIDESIAQAQAAASRAATLLARDTILFQRHGGLHQPAALQRLRDLREYLSLFGAELQRQGQGRDQSGALQGLRLVRRLVPLGRHSA